MMELARAGGALRASVTAFSECPSQVSSSLASFLRIADAGGLLAGIGAISSDYTEMARCGIGHMMGKATASASR